MRRQLLILAGIAMSVPIEAAEPWVGMWQYQGARAAVNVVLKDDGSCLVGAMLMRHIEARLVPCSYTVAGDGVRLEWKHQIDGETPTPALLFYNAGADTFVIEGEPSRVLKRDLSNPR